MKDLSERVRAGMNLMLILALVQMWIWSTGFVTPNMVRQVAQNVLSILYVNSDNPHHQYPPGVLALRAFDDANSEKYQQGLVLRVPLSIFLDIPADDVRFKVKSSRAEIAALAADAKKAGLDNGTILKRQVERETWNPEEVAAELGQLQDVALDAGLKPTDTVSDLVKTFRRRIRAPWIDKEVDISQASFYLGLAQIAVALLVAVTVDEIWIAIRARQKSVPKEIPDIIIAYRSKWANYLGIAWLVILPVISIHLAYSQLKGTAFGILFAVVALVPAICTLARADSIRKAVHGV